MGDFMAFNYEDFYKILNVSSHVAFENKLREIVTQKDEREQFYRALIELNPIMSQDTFKPYFEIYSAERKTNMQDYTPNEIATIMSLIGRQTQKGSGQFTAYDMTAGTGALIINKWNDDRMQEAPWTYAPHRYFYFAEEFADNAIPYLIHNMAIRGMNAIVVHGDSLHRKAKQVYFIQNSIDDFMAFSDINIMPHSEAVAKEFDIREWLEDEIDHVESTKVVWQKAFPSLAKPLKVNPNPKIKPRTPMANMIKLGDVAKVERAKKGKVYQKGTIIVQLSATRGQVGLLKSNGEVGSQYATIELSDGEVPSYWFYLMKRDFPKHRHRVQQGLNLTLDDVASFPIMESLEVEYIDFTLPYWLR